MRFTTRGIATGWLAVALTLGVAGGARADEALKRVQQSLRDQGFYYGTIDGAPGDETTQALRRYQIRNGLTVTGQLNPETINALARTGGAGSGASARSPSTTSTPAITSRSVPPPSTPPPLAKERNAAPPANEPDYRLAPREVVRPPANTREEITGDEEPRNGGGGAAPQPGYRGSSPDQRDPRDSTAQGRGLGEPSPPPARYGSAPSPGLIALFEQTPYEFAPPVVQADLLRRAQKYLLRSGFYDGEADGVPDRRTSEAIANFQEVNRLRPTARLDVRTLGAMRLLPERRVERQVEVVPRVYNGRRPPVIYEGRIAE